MACGCRVKAIQKEGARQNKALDSAAESTDRGRDGVGDMLDTMHGQGYGEVTAKEARVYSAARAAGGGGGR